MFFTLGKCKWSIFSIIRAFTLQSVAALTSVHCARVSELLLMLLVVHPLSGNSVLNCLALYPFN